MTKTINMNTFWSQLETEHEDYMAELDAAEAADRVADEKAKRYGWDKDSN